MIAFFSTTLTFLLFTFALIGMATVMAFGKFLLFILGGMGILIACYAAVAGLDRAAAKCFNKAPSKLTDIGKTALTTACWLTVIGLFVLLARSLLS